MKKLKRVYTTLITVTDVLDEDKKDRGLLGRNEGVNAAFVMEELRAFRAEITTFRGETRTVLAALPVTPPAPPAPVASAALVAPPAGFAFRSRSRSRGRSSTIPSRGTRGNSRN